MVSDSQNFYPITDIQDRLDPDVTKSLRQVPVRMEVDEWFHSQDIIHVNQRALFFPAFLKLAEMDPKEKLSWFQIAGIHGKPYTPWDEGAQDGKTPNEGYCTHASVLFATWHRAYMLLWEQVIYQLMLKEIDEYKEEVDREELREAANVWRFPYWDWALKKPNMDPENPNVYDYNVPAVIQHEYAPKGYSTLGDEQLCHWKFTESKVDISELDANNKDKKKITTIPYNLSEKTVRHLPQVIVAQKNDKSTLDEWRRGTQDNNAIAKMMQAFRYGNTTPQSNEYKDSEESKDYNGSKKSNAEKFKKGNLTARLRDAFYRILTITSFEDFASKRFPDADSQEQQRKDYAYDSSENLHDVMHLFCGGFPQTIDEGKRAVMGHMSHVPVAAFDPIFWLHHCNVDRMFAIWQVLHDNQNEPWFTGSDSRDNDPGNFGIARWHPDRPEDNLRPFHSTDKGDVEKSYHTSYTVRRISELGYTYPGLEKWKHTTDGEYNVEKHRRALASSLNGMYNSARDSTYKWLYGSHLGDVKGENISRSVQEIQLLRKKMKLSHALDYTWKARDYVVNIVYERMALEGKMFTVNIYLGDVPKTLEDGWEKSPNLVGRIFNFTAAADIGNQESSGGCGNCKKQSEDKTRASGRVILTNALITRWANSTVEDAPIDLLQNPAETDKKVTDYLVKNLNWQVVCGVNKIVDLEKEANLFPSLKVSAAFGYSRHYGDCRKMSTFGDYEPVYEITKNKAGGATAEDGLYEGDELRVVKPAEPAALATTVPTITTATGE